LGNREVSQEQIPFATAEEDRILQPELNSPLEGWTAMLDGVECILNIGFLAFRASVSLRRESPKGEGGCTLQLALLSSLGGGGR